MSQHPSRVTEASVQRAVLQCLELLGVDAWRQNVGVFRAEHKGKVRYIRCGLKGQADVMGILPGGRMLAIEVKRPGKGPTADQVAFMRRVNRLGGVAFWATSSDVVEDVLGSILGDPRLRVDVKPDGSMDLTDEELPR